MLLDAAREALRIRDEKVVAHKLHAAPKLRGQCFPAGPVLLAERVLDRTNRVFFAKILPIGRQLRGGQACAAFWKEISVFIGPFAGSRVNCENKVVVWLIAGLLDGAQQHPYSVLVAGEIGRIAAFIPDGGRMAVAFQDAGERVKNLCAPAKSFGK